MDDVGFHSQRTVVIVIAVDFIKQDISLYQSI